MENKCLITTLQGEMSGQNLPKFGNLKVSAKWLDSDFVYLYYGPGTSKNKIDDDLVINIIEGGTIDGETSITIPKGSTASPFTYLTITKTSGSSNLILVINNKYTLNGFGFSNRIGQIKLSQSDIETLVNVNRITLRDVYETTFNISDLVEGLYGNGWRKSSLDVYCYSDFSYALYEGDSHVSTAITTTTITFNNDLKEYTITINNAVVAKRKLVEGVWVSQPTT